MIGAIVEAGKVKRKTRRGAPVSDWGQRLLFSFGMYHDFRITDFFI